jgi:hypothetical protein
MRDGVRLATDIYRPGTGVLPTIVMRTPYGRRTNPEAIGIFASRGYAVVAQDCRGTGGSEPDEWDCYVYEREDSYDLIEWIVQQAWYDGFICGYGSSYLAGTQWCMANHPAMTAIVPEVGGLGLRSHLARYHTFVNAYSRSVGKGVDKSEINYAELEKELLSETLNSGYYEQPISETVPSGAIARFPSVAGLELEEARRALWVAYCDLSPADRANFIKEILDTDNITLGNLEDLVSVFGPMISVDSHMYAHGSSKELVEAIHAAPLIIAGWYDWYLDDLIATWEAIQRFGKSHTRASARLIIAPSSHNVAGYHEGENEYPELKRSFRGLDIIDVLASWYDTSRKQKFGEWPKVIYYLMGANEWCISSSWPPAEVRTIDFYLAEDGKLSTDPPTNSVGCDEYYFDPTNPTPTVGGSLLSFVYRPGSADLSAVQRRCDVLTYSTNPLSSELDVVGPMKAIIYVRTDVLDTDFFVRLSDVFPDGRAIQLQSGMVRTRFRTDSRPRKLNPNEIYRLEVDLWATANRFREGHAIRIDISSADFPRVDRNPNTGARGLPPLKATQRIYRTRDKPSHVTLPIFRPVLSNKESYDVRCQ